MWALKSFSVTETPAPMLSYPPAPPALLPLLSSSALSLPRLSCWARCWWRNMLYLFQSEVRTYFTPLRVARQVEFCAASGGNLSLQDSLSDPLTVSASGGEAVLVPTQPNRARPRARHWQGSDLWGVTGATYGRKLKEGHEIIVVFHYRSNDKELKGVFFFFVSHFLLLFITRWGKNVVKHHIRGPASVSLFSVSTALSHTHNHLLPPWAHDVNGSSSGSRLLLAVAKHDLTGRGTTSTPFIRRFYVIHSRLKTALMKYVVSAKFPSFEFVQKYYLVRQGQQKWRTRVWWQKKKNVWKSVKQCHVGHVTGISVRTLTPGRGCILCSIILH